MANKLIEKLFIIYVAFPEPKYWTQKESTLK